jgi:hypothetical protein
VPVAREDDINELARPVAEVLEQPIYHFAAESKVQTINRTRG